MNGPDPGEAALHVDWELNAAPSLLCRQAPSNHTRAGCCQLIHSPSSTGTCRLPGLGEEGEEEEEGEEGRPRDTQLQLESVLFCEGSLRGDRSLCECLFMGIVWVRGVL